MAEKNNATCSICGSGYHICLSCKDAIQLSPWKVHCCSADCYKTYQVVRGLSTGVYTDEEFKSKLKNLDLSNLENYRDHIKAIIKNALKEENPVVKIAENIEPIVEVESVVEVVESVEAEIAEVKKETVEKPIVSRKRSYKVETK